MDMKAMDAEVGEFTEESKNLGKGKEKAIDAEFNEEGKSLRDKKSLKRPIDAVDAVDDDGGGLGDDKDSDENKFPIFDNPIWDCSNIEKTFAFLQECSNIEKTFEHPNFKNITSRLEGDSSLAAQFGNILNILKKKDITRGDADDFKKMVEDVLGNDHFLAELFREFEDEWCISIVEYCAEKTQDPVGNESNNQRMALIRGDNYFSQASAGENNETIVRGALSIIVSYCLSSAELDKIWIRGHNDEQFGLKDFDWRYM